jgi:hypothetical protein
LPPPPGPKSKKLKQGTRNFLSRFLLNTTFVPEDGDDMFFRNVPDVTRIYGYESQRGVVYTSGIHPFFVRVSPDVISRQLCTPKVVGVQFKLYAVYNLHLK